MKCVDLRGRWMMRQIGKTEWMAAQVPGSVYSDLLSAGKIEDPFFRDNELAVKTLSENDYEYLREFTVDASVLKSDRIELCCSGLDTLAEISINGHPVAATDNMHRSYEFDIKSVLVKGVNRIHLVFRSPLAYIREKQERRPLWNAADAEAGIGYLRKAHYMFGWDWGPTLPDMGIWRGIAVKAYDTARLSDVAVRQTHHGESVALDVAVAIERLTAASIDVSVEILSPDGLALHQSVSGVSDTQKIPIRIDNPQLWWPNGQGEQPLYQVRVTLTGSGATLDERILTIGLRTLTIRQEPDEWGKEFAFVINGKAIFAMGANYIPEDNILSRRSPEQTQRLIESCVAANFNAIRVWGGGHYPEDYFYDLCDRYGLIVWQDFAFACAIYDLTDDFADTVRKEAEDNVRRLRHHASLGLWCGNNEMEWFAGQENLFTEKDKRDYLAHFEELLPGVVAEHDPDTYYWPASPSSGGGFDRPNDENHGDVHDWNVWHGRRSFYYFRDHHYRFLSEFGLQSFPCLKTVESYTLPEERNVFSPIMEHHQKNGSGNQTILHYISRTFRFPKDLDSLIYASQLVQGEGMRYAVEHLRRNRGRCMGTIYWQLNDCWPAASWASLDSFGRWKALHYFAKRFYRPILVSACEDRSTATIHVTNETQQPVTGCLFWKLRDTNSETVEKGERDITIEPLTAAECESVSFPELAADPSRQRQVYLEYGLMVNGKSVSCEAILFGKPRHFEFKDPNIRCRVEDRGDSFEITAESDAFANYVELRIGKTDAVFSDNYFHLSKGEPRIITLDKQQLDGRASAETIRQQLTVRSIYDIDEFSTAG